MREIWFIIFTWGALLRQIPSSTKMSTIRWQRRAVHLAEYINVCDTTSTLRRAQRSALIKPSSLLPSYMAQSCGSLVGITSDFSKDSSNAASTPYLTSAAVASLPVLKHQGQATEVPAMGTSGGVMVGNLVKQTYTSEFESHWVPHTNGLVPHLSKRLSKLLLKFQLCLQDKESSPAKYHSVQRVLRRLLG